MLEKVARSDSRFNAAAQAPGDHSSSALVKLRAYREEILKSHARRKKWGRDALQKA
jgi:hypothetical protein